MPNPKLTESDIVVGGTYRAKRFRELFGCTNDRYILWISEDRALVQYDSDTVRNGRHYPKTTMSAFLNWARERVV